MADLTIILLYVVPHVTKNERCLLVHVTARFVMPLKYQYKAVALC